MSENNGPVPTGDNPYRAPDQEPFAPYRAPEQPYGQPANPQYTAQPGPQLPYPGPAYPGPGQPYPTQPYGQPYGFAQPAPRNGMAIGALIVSIVAFLLAVIPFISVAGVVAAIVAVVVSVYVDYMCPYCGQFEAVNGPTLDQLRGDGTIIVEYHPVSILDEASLGTAYSTRAAAAAALVADQAPEAFVAFNTALFATQPAENTAGLTDAEIAALARGAGVPEAVASTIESGAYLAGPGSFVNWVGAATDRAAQDLGRLATPTVLIDGAPLNADWAAPGALAQAIADARG